MKHPLSTAAMALTAMLVSASSASAQATTTTNDPTREFGGGYQSFRLGQVCDTGAITQTCSANRTLPLGFAVDGARNFGPWGLVGEGGWSTDSEEELSFNTWHLAGGGRWTSRRHDRLWPYAQVLLGLVQDRVSGTTPAGSEVDRSITSFMLQPGAGVTYLLGRSWGVFGQMDYRRVFLDEEENLSNGRNDFRLLLGARVFLP
jgi:hypothetical protein